MDLNLYFNSVCLEKPDLSHLKDTDTFGRSIDINTPDTPIKDIENYDLAIMGIEEDRNAFIRGSAKAPDVIRQKLFLLGYVNKKTKIIDLGNLKITDNINDSYFALRDIYLELVEKNVILLILGGSQDLAIGVAKAFENHKKIWNVTSLDSRLDFNFPKEELKSNNYLDSLLKIKSSKYLNFCNIGQQVYFTTTKQIDKFEKKGLGLVRLGQIRDNITQIEPLLRDTDFLISDLGVVKQSDAPGASLLSPNGLRGYEYCQILRYAGASSKIKSVLFSEYIPENDLNGMSSHLVAQAIWYFVEGLSLRKDEDPLKKGSKKFIVSSSSSEQNIVFYKSNTTDRWWMQIPFNNGKDIENILISCSYEDYQKACTNEIPDLWWKFMRRFS